MIILIMVLIQNYHLEIDRVVQLTSRTINEKVLLLRIRSQYPGFWRVLGFDFYTGQGWKILREETTATIKRSPWNYRFDLSLPPLQGNTQKVIQTYSIVNDIPNIIPTLRYTKSLFFPSQQIALDSEGSLRAPAGLIEGLTYTAISYVPYRSQSRLQSAGKEYSDITTKYYLQIPQEIKEKVKLKAEELLAKSDRPLISNYDIALYLAQEIKRNYTIEVAIPPLSEGEDLAETFLYKNQGGYPDHFATVYTLMLRSLGIPARLAVGFGTGDFNPFTGYYLVHNTDAHALTEVYFPEYGWFDFDPLPGHEIIPQSFQDDNAFGLLGEIWKWVASWLPSPITGLISGTVALIKKLVFDLVTNIWLVRLWRFFAGSLVGLLTGILALITLTFLMWLAFNYVRKLRYAHYLNRLHPLDKLYREMLDLLGENGHRKKPSQTPYEYAYSLRHQFMEQRWQVIDNVTIAYVQWRYGNLDFDIASLRSQLASLRQSFSQKETSKVHS